jgi:hypothetical protein
MNEAVLGVFRSDEQAREEARFVRECYAGPWEQLTPDAWCSGAVTRLEIEPHVLHE